MDNGFYQVIDLLIPDDGNSGFTSSVVIEWGRVFIIMASNQGFTAREQFFYLLNILKVV